MMRNLALTILLTLSYGSHASPPLTGGMDEETQLQLVEKLKIANLDIGWTMYESLAITVTLLSRDDKNHLEGGAGSYKARSIKTRAGCHKLAASIKDEAKHTEIRAYGTYCPAGDSNWHSDDQRLIIIYT